MIVWVVGWGLISFIIQFLHMMCRWGSGGWACVLTDSHVSRVIGCLWACGLIRLRRPLEWGFIQLLHIMWGLSEVCATLDSYAYMLIASVVGFGVN
jgi:hypothetical protein